MSEFVFEDEIPFGANVEDLEIDDHMSDMEADDCVQKINNIERYRKMWLDFYQKKIDELNLTCDNNIAYQKRKLRYFFGTVLHRNTQTMEAYDLPSGRLSMSFAKQKLVPNKEAIVKRFIESGDREFVKTTVKEELDWNNYKKRLFVSDAGDVLDRETGEIVSDVAVEITEPVFDVK